MLKTLFIVSAAKVEEGSAEGAFEGEFGIKVKVAAAAGEKCERCWMFSETVGSDANHPTLCSRCAAAVPEGAGE